MGLPGGSGNFVMLLRLFLLLMIGRAAAQDTYPAPGWQKLAACRRAQQWPEKIVRHVVAIFATNSPFWHVIANLI